MKHSENWQAICQDAGDGSGDLIVELPPAVIEKVGVGPGDELVLEIVDGIIILTPKRSPSNLPSEL
ncbi:AbrB/MazE/SpoVT family DNA-binding domain-containing protein [uncultured Pseudomonas sp.]|uniref:AbrB/MazE/SpoVT family DNA-binding domain-containing protein n=1 Tax=uncultured Pseudomonas sp. TaxID=114707 RepID=UPI0030D75462|tara:strand:- start:1190 stop:1387 length:198 start_codon:yes stop_codon:yes gene_type:complete